jgi:hypothetical protein
VTLPAEAATLELAARAPRAAAAELTAETRAGRSIAKLMLAPGEEARRSVTTRGEPVLLLRWRALPPKRGRASAETAAGADRYELVVGAAP